MNKQNPQSDHKVNLATDYDGKRRLLAPYAAAFNFLLFSTGTAMVATPYSFSLMTPWVGVAAEFALITMGYCAGMCLFNACASYNVVSFTELGEKVFGKHVIGRILSLILVELPVLLVLVGSLSAYIIISSTIVDLYTTIDPLIFKILFTLLIGFIGTINSYQNSRYISYAGFLIFIIVVTLNSAVSSQLLDDFDIPLRSFSFSNFVQAIPVMSLGFNGYMPIAGMSSEMSKKSQANFYKYFFLVLFLIAILNTAAGLIPSLVFGNTVGNDSLEQLANTWYAMYGHYNTAIIVAHILLAVILCVQSPVFILPLKSFVLDRNGKTVMDRSILVNFLWSMFFAFISGMLAILIPNVTDALNTVATIGGFILGGPTAAYVSYLTETTPFSKFRQLYSLIVGGFLIGVNFYTIWYTYAVPEDEQYPI